MELTTKQIEKIEHYLNVKNIVYIDVRLEVLDHIISDIEVIIEKENIDFETAFYKVTNKWNVHLKDTTSWIFGVMYSAPKVVIEKAKSIFKKWSLLIPIIYFGLFFLLEDMNLVFSNHIENIFNLCFQVISVISFLLFIFLMISKNKKKTTYSFILKTYNSSLLIGIILLFDFDFLNKEGGFNFIQVYILVLFMLSTYIYYHFYKKHQKAVKKYQSL